MNLIAEDVQFIKPAIDQCYHCGEPNPTNVILHDDKSFCCEGCKMVYSILDENDLCNFYDLNANAGISQRSVDVKSFAYLDDPDAVQKLLDFSNEDIAKVRFYIPQIHCSSCLWLLENLFKINPAVTQSRVDFLNKEVRLTYKVKDLSLRQLVELLSSIGYEPYIQLHDLEDKSPSQKVDKSLYYRLGLAGFAFGNIMLFSFPEYLGLAESGDSGFNTVFSYLNLLLILPVLFYSAQGYWKSAYQGLKQRHLNIDVPICLGILALFLRSVFEIVTATGPGYLDSLAGLIFFLLVGRWFQHVTYARISFDRDFKSYFPIACNVRRDGENRQLTLDKIQKNDIIIIKHGEMIPADGILTSGKAEIDYSFVSGESDPVNPDKGALIYAGGKQMGGALEMVVTKTVSNSYLTQLWNDHSFSKNEKKGRTTQLADKVARFFTVAILLVAFSTLFYWLPIDVSKAINAFSSVLIIACPCAVALSIPFTFGNALRVLSTNGIYLKNIHVIESLAKVNNFVFDKTGTLTSIQDSHLIYKGKDLPEHIKDILYAMVSASSHPVSRQVSNWLGDREALTLSHFEEIKGMGLVARLDDLEIRLGSPSLIFEEGNSYSHSNHLWLEIEGEIWGHFKKKAAFRSAVKEVIDQFKHQGKLSLISGDNEADKAHLQTIFDKDTSLHFNQKPIDKLNYLKSMQNDTSVVAMIGDGLNDAGALKQSDVGIVLTEDTSNFTPACDVIMDARHFSKMPALFAYAKDTINVVLAAYGIALIYNIIGLSFAVQGLLSPVIAAILMPLSSISIVIFGTLLSSYLAQKRIPFSNKTAL